MSTAKWANIGDDAGALHALVENVREHAAVATIDYLWIFPPRKVATGESVVVVVGAFDEDPERRRVITAHYTVSRSKKGEPTVKSRIDEHGSAPTAAVPRIVQGVLRRLGEDVDASPREEQVGGDEARWDALIVELGGRPRAAEPEPAGESAGDAAAADEGGAAPAPDGDVA
jgi:hypothetical protein